MEADAAGWSFYKQKNSNSLKYLYSFLCHISTKGEINQANLFAEPLTDMIKLFFCSIVFAKELLTIYTTLKQLQSN